MVVFTLSQLPINFTMLMKWMCMRLCMCQPIIMMTMIGLMIVNCLVVQLTKECAWRRQDVSTIANTGTPKARFDELSNLNLGSTEGKHTETTNKPLCHHSFSEHKFSSLLSTLFLEKWTFILDSKRKYYYASFDMILSSIKPWKKPFTKFVLKVATFSISGDFLWEVWPLRISWTCIRSSH